MKRSPNLEIKPERVQLLSGYTKDTCLKAEALYKALESDPNRSATRAVFGIYSFE